MTQYPFRLVSRWSLFVGSVWLVAACGAADEPALESEPMLKVSEEELSTSAINLCKRFGINCRLPQKTIDCNETPECAECCSGLYCRSVFACCNPYDYECVVEDRTAPSSKDRPGEVPSDPEIER